MNEKTNHWGGKIVRGKFTWLARRGEGELVERRRHHHGGWELRAPVSQSARSGLRAGVCFH